MLPEKKMVAFGNSMWQKWAMIVPWTPLSVIWFVSLSSASKWAHFLIIVPLVVLINTQSSLSLTQSFIRILSPSLTLFTLLIDWLCTIDTSTSFLFNWPLWRTLTKTLSILTSAISYHRFICLPFFRYSISLDRRLWSCSINNCSRCSFHNGSCWISYGRIQCSGNNYPGRKDLLTGK